MVVKQIDATIFFRHSEQEVADLSAAIIPLADHIKAVSTPQARTRMRHILGMSGQCGYFRAHEAKTMRWMLLSAAKHAKANLGDYFELMRADILRSAKILEDATERYWNALQYAIDEVTPSQ